VPPVFDSRFGHLLNLPRCRSTFPKGKRSRCPNPNETKSVGIEYYERSKLNAKFYVLIIIFIIIVISEHFLVEMMETNKQKPRFQVMQHNNVRMEYASVVILVVCPCSIIINVIFMMYVNNNNEYTALHFNDKSE
jgi:hypothetical protein